MRGPPEDNSVGDRLFRSLLSPYKYDYIVDELNETIHMYYNDRWPRARGRSRAAIQASEGFNGWGSPSFHNNSSSRYGKVLFIRGVRFFDVKHNFNRVISVVPYANHVRLNYGETVPYEDFASQLLKVNDGVLKGIIGLVRARDGVFLARCSWTVENLRQEKEVIAIYGRGDEDEAAWVSTLPRAMIKHCRDRGTPPNCLPSPQEQSISGLIVRAFNLKDHNINGPDPLYIDQLEEIEPSREQNLANRSIIREATTAVGVDIYDYQEMEALRRNGLTFEVPLYPDGRPMPEYIIGIWGTLLLVLSPIPLAFYYFWQIGALI